MADLAVDEDDKEEGGGLGRDMASTCSTSSSGGSARVCIAWIADAGGLVPGMDKTTSAAFAISSRFGALGSAASLAFPGNALRKITMNKDVSASPGCRLLIYRRRSEGVLSPNDVTRSKSPALSYLLRWKCDNNAFFAST